MATIYSYYICTIYAYGYHGYLPILVYANPSLSEILDITQPSPHSYSANWRLAHRYIQYDYCVYEVLAIKVSYVLSVVQAHTCFPLSTHNPICVVLP